MDRMDGKLDTINENVTAMHKRQSYVDASTQYSPTKEDKLDGLSRINESDDDEVDIWYKMVMKYSKMDSQEQAMDEVVDLYLRLSDEDKEKIRKSFVEKVTKATEERRGSKAKATRERDDLINETVELIGAYNDTYDHDVIKMLKIGESEKPEFIKDLEESVVRMEEDERAKVREHGASTILPSPEDLLNSQPEMVAERLHHLNLAEVEIASLRVRIMFAKYTLDALRSPKGMRPARPRPPRLDSNLNRGRRSFSGMNCRLSSYIIAILT